ncbi:MAG TPA: hypothetical protein VIE43_09860 [Thermoanaerobaculia bacterium]|jgi:hypothetical protein|nr:hypothetical protein [Thermoanaerobaculia bacterium]
MTIARETTNAGKLGKLQKLAASLAANSGDLPNLAASITQLTGLVAQAQDAAKLQAALTASKQEASQQLYAILSDGSRLGTVLQLAVKQHYGIRAEKLAEFGLQPFRGRKPVKPVLEAHDPAPTVTPKTAGFAPTAAHAELP